MMKHWKIFFTYIYENTLGYDYEEDDDDYDDDDDNYDDDSSEHPINQTTPSANAYFTNDTIICILMNIKLMVQTNQVL